MPSLHFARATAELDEVVMTAKLLNPRGAMGGAVAPVLSIAFNLELPANALSAAPSSSAFKLGWHVNANWLQRGALLTAIPLLHFGVRAVVDVTYFVKNVDVAAHMVACLLGWSIAAVLQVALDAVSPALLSRLHSPRALVCWFVMLWLMRNFSQPAMDGYWTSTASEGARVAALSSCGITIAIGALVYGADRGVTADSRPDAHSAAALPTEGNGSRVLMLCTIAAHFDLLFHVAGVIQSEMMHDTFGSLVGFDVAQGGAQGGRYPRPYDASGWAAFGVLAAFIVSGLGLGALASVMYGAVYTRAGSTASTFLLVTAIAGFVVMATYLTHNVDLLGLPCTPDEWRSLLKTSPNAVDCTANSMVGFPRYFGSLWIQLGILAIFGFAMHASKRLAGTEAWGNQPNSIVGAHGDDSNASRDESSSKTPIGPRAADIEQRLHELEQMVERLAHRERMDYGVEGSTRRRSPTKINRATTQGLEMPA